MKVPAALCLLCALPALAQTTSPKVQAESRVPSVTISAAGQDGGNSNFLLRNNSGRRITAFDVLVVPKGVPKKNGHYVCKGRCSDYPEIGDLDQPVIPANGKEEKWYPTDKCAGGAVIVEAVVYDDGTYAGSERTAARLVATQLGNQAGFDGIVSSINAIVGENGLQNNGAAAQIESSLTALPTDADGEELDNFSRWFPNIHDCSSRFSQIMEKASSNVVALVSHNLQVLSEKGPPSEGALIKWWETTQHILQDYGCAGCANKLSTPTPPARLRKISVGCHTHKSATSVAGISSGTSSGDSDGSPDAGDLDAEDDAGMEAGGDDTTDQSAANDSDSGNAPAQAASNSQPVTTPQAPEPSADSAATAMDAPDSDTPSSARTVFPPLPHAPSQRCLPIPPRPMGLMASARVAAGERPPARPMTDEQFYPRYFRYVEQWDRCLADGQWPDSTLERYPDPYPPDLNDDQVEIVRLVSVDWIETHPSSGASLRPPNNRTSPLTISRPTTWAQAQQGLQLRQHLMEERNERARLVDARVQSLRLALGKAAFRALNDYAHDLYQAIPGQLAREPLPESLMYARYLRFIALMDNFAANNDEDGQSAARARSDEQTACGLSDPDEAILQREADALRRLPRPGDPINRPHPMTAATGSIEAEKLPDFSAGAPALRPEERIRMTSQLVERLQSSLSKTGFEKVEKRVHALYDSEGINRVVPVAEPEPDSKQATVQEPSPQSK